LNNRRNVLEGLVIETSNLGIRLGDHPHCTTFSPAEADKVSNIVSIAGGMEGVELPHIQSSPFRVYFSKTGMVLLKNGQDGDGLRFTYNDIDKVIRAVSIGVEMYRDAQVHRGEPAALAAVGPANDLVDDI